jgi:hypothetical protein
MTQFLEQLRNLKVVEKNGALLLSARERCRRRGGSVACRCERGARAS